MACDLISPPGLVINEKLVSSGRIPTQAEIGARRVRVYAVAPTTEAVYGMQGDVIGQHPTFTVAGRTGSNSGHGQQGRHGRC